jgi:HSP20 family protein
MLMRFEPFTEFTQAAEGRSERQSRQLPVDAFRTGDVFTVLLDIPGADPGSIELTVEKDVLAVHAVRTWKKDLADQVLITERHKGEFSRQLFLGESLDRDAIRATYDDGVLTITIPVIEQMRPRKVEIAHVGGGAETVEAAMAVTT